MRFKVNIIGEQTGEVSDNFYDFTVIIEKGKTYVGAAYTPEYLAFDLKHNNYSYFSWSDFIIVRDIKLSTLACALADVIKSDKLKIFGKGFKLKQVYEETSFDKLDYPCFDTEDFLEEDEYMLFDKNNCMVTTEILVQKFKEEYLQIALKYRDNIGFKKDQNYQKSKFFKKEKLYHEIEYLSFFPSENIYAMNKPIRAHPFFDELKIWLQEVCVENELLRVFIPSWIPNDY